MKVRLAFREEGRFWNCYLARSDTMKDARHLGSILMGAVRHNEQTKKLFMDAMKSALTDAIEETTGKFPTNWTTEPAPEAERSGHS